MALWFFTLWSSSSNCRAGLLLQFLLVGGVVVWSCVILTLKVPVWFRKPQTALERSDPGRKGRQAPRAPRWRLSLPAGARTRTRPTKRGEKSPRPTRRPSPWTSTGRSARRWSAPSATTLWTARRGSSTTATWGASAATAPSGPPCRSCTTFSRRWAPARTRVYAPPPGHPSVTRRTARFLFI